MLEGNHSKPGPRNAQARPRRSVLYKLLPLSNSDKEGGLNIGVFGMSCVGSNGTRILSAGSGWKGDTIGDEWERENVYVIQKRALTWDNFTCDWY